jgi:hypothetical protein
VLLAERSQRGCEVIFKNLAVAVDRVEQRHTAAAFKRWASQRTGDAGSVGTPSGGMTSSAHGPRTLDRTMLELLRSGVQVTCRASPTESYLPRSQQADVLCSSPASLG